MENKEPYFFLSKNLKEIKIIIENIIFESNGCGIIYGDEKTGKTAFVNYILRVNQYKKEIKYFPAEEIVPEELQDLENSVLIIDDVHLLSKESINRLKNLCDKNFVIFVVNKEYLMLLKEFLKDKSLKFSLEIMPISKRELEALIEQYIRVTDKSIYKNKELIDYIYELTGGRLGDIFLILDKINDLVYYFSLKSSYRQKVKYLTIFLLIFLSTTVLLALVYFKDSIKKTYTENKPVIEQTKKKLNINTPKIESQKEEKVKKKNTQDLNINDQHRKGMVLASVINLRKDPSLNSQILKKLKRLTVVEILEEKKGWYGVSYNGLNGWLKKEYIKVPSKGFAIVKAYYLNLRKEPDPKSEILIKLTYSDKLKISEEEKGKWIKVKYKFEDIYIQGWVSKQFLLY